MGQDRAALTLARAGWRVSARSVRRIAREPQHRTVPEDAGAPKPSRPVIARFVHHTWMMDVTEIPAFLGGQVFHLAGVFDAFSRAPLALQLSPCRPRACDMARLLRPRLAPSARRSTSSRISEASSEDTPSPRPSPAARSSTASPPAPPHHRGPGAKARTRPRLLPPPSASSGAPRRDARRSPPRHRARLHEDRLPTQRASRRRSDPATLHRPAPRSGAPPPDPDSRGVAETEKASTGARSLGDAGLVRLG